jgi:hypothetical protein
MFLHGEHPTVSVSVEDRLVDRKTAARFLSISPNTLAVWDSTKRHNLKPTKVGRAVRYRMSVLIAFLEERTKP